MLQPRRTGGNRRQIRIHKVLNAMDLLKSLKIKYAALYKNREQLHYTK